jgi:hypothetical protein
VFLWRGAVDLKLGLILCISMLLGGRMALFLSARWLRRIFITAVLGFLEYRTSIASCLFRIMMSSTEGQCGSDRTALIYGAPRLEVKPDLSRQGARRHIMRSTEGREEVIQRQFVGDVNGGKRQTPLVMVALEQIIVAH